MSQKPVSTQAPPQPPPAAAHHTSVAVDFYNGAVRGDFAPELGLAGITAQVVFGFVPVIGTLCALRDLIACRRYHDGLGMVLNGFSLIPFLGGLPKVAEVARSVRLYAEGLHAVHSVHHGLTARQRPAAGAAAPVEHRPNPASVFSLLIGLFIPVLTPLLAVGFLQWVAPRLHVAMASQILVVGVIGLAVPLLAVVTGHAGRRRARGQMGYGSGRGKASVGLTLGYLYLVAFAIIAGIFLAIYRPDFSHLFATIFAARAPGGR
ncbi:MAG TPA: hypothetical protein VIG30_04195 [Ktedonobacterales bacterium]|jgi:hypothetical protein